MVTIAHLHSLCVSRLLKQMNLEYQATAVLPTFLFIIEPYLIMYRPSIATIDSSADKRYMTVTRYRMFMNYNLLAFVLVFVKMENNK
jgi:hypothetical protein